MPDRYDAIIVGGGHNGLVTAFYLARAGLKVLVLERHPVVGGASITEELWPGFKVSTAAYLGGFVYQQVAEDMELSRRGYEVVPQNPEFFCPFPDGRYLLIWQDLDRTLEEICRFSQKDAAAYPRYLGLLQRLGSFLKPLLPLTPPRLPPRGLRDWIEALPLARAFWRMTEEDLGNLVKVLSLSCRDLLDEFFESEEVKAALASQSVVSANGGPFSPGTGYILLHHTLGEGSWGFVRGGMGTVTRAMAEAAKGQGVEIRTGVEVSSIRVVDGMARGVALSGGEVIESRLVASNADPQRTFLKLVNPEHLPSDFLYSIRNFKMTSLVSKLNMAVSELPDFLSFPGKTAGPQHRACIDISPSLEYLERAWDDAKYGGYSRRPFVEMVIPSSVDDNLAPPGKHILNLYVQFCSYRLKGTSWDQERERWGDRVVETLAEYAPNVKTAVLHRQVLSPPDLEERFGLTGGNVFHGAMSPDQFFFLRPAAGWSRYRAPVRNLYLCGSGAHPGGGVRGLPGFNAAREILSDL